MEKVEKVEKVVKVVKVVKVGPLIHHHLVVQVAVTAQQDQTFQQQDQSAPHFIQERMSQAQLLLTWLHNGVNS